MSVITMSTGILMGAFSMEQIGYDMDESSDATGAESTRIFGPPRWRAALAAMPDMSLAQAAEWEAIAMKLNRRVNHLAVWDPVRIAPRGTMRGSLTLNATVVAGVTSVELAGASGTLLVGDWLQIGAGVGTSQLVKVVLDTTASGSLATVTFEPSLRIGFNSGTTVTWDRPVFYGKQIAKSVKWEYQAGNLLQSGFALDILEQFN